MWADPGYTLTMAEGVLACLVAPPSQDPAAVDACGGAAWKVCHVSDTHTHHGSLDLGEGDVLVHSGDFTMRGTREEVLEFCEWLSRQRYTHKVVVPGNHELSLDTARFKARLQKFAAKPAQLENLKRSCDPALFVAAIRAAGAVYLDHAGVELLGYNVFGTPYVPPVGEWAFCAPLEERERLFRDIPAGTDVLITHAPPHGILDAEAGSGKRRGCPALRKRVAELQPAVHCFGHAHAGHGAFVAEGTAFVNAAVCDEDYSALQKPMYFALKKKP